MWPVNAKRQNYQNKAAIRIYEPVLTTAAVCRLCSLREQQYVLICQHKQRIKKKNAKSYHCDGVGNFHVLLHLA